MHIKSPRNLLHCTYQSCGSLVGFHPSKYHNLLRSFFADQSIFRLYQMKCRGCSNQFPFRQKEKKDFSYCQRKNLRRYYIASLNKFPRRVALRHRRLLPPAEKHLIFDTTLRVNLLQRHGNERIPVKNVTAYLSISNGKRRIIFMLKIQLPSSSWLRG